MKLRHHLGRWGSVALAAGALTLATGGTPAAADSNSHIRPAATTIEQQADVRDYWSAERMRDATPMSQLLGKGGLVDLSELSQLKEVARGVPELVTPQAFPESGGPWDGGGAIETTTGRVFFEFGGQDASCSGNAVVSDNKSTVITAGHCVKYQGEWHTNWVFVPGYDNGDRPYGTWAAKSTAATPQWVENEDLNYDVGAAVVNPLDGELLTDVVGAQAIAFNQPRNQAMYAFGYPAADPYDGSELIYCSGNTFTDFLLTNDHAMSCDMTGGSSGGPWFLEFDEGSGTGAQASVNSFGYTFLPGYMFGPYFGTEAQNLYNEVQGS